MTKKKLYIEVDKKKILIGEVEIFETFDIPYNLINPTSILIEKIKLFRNEGDTVDLNYE